MAGANDGIEHAFDDLSDGVVLLQGDAPGRVVYANTAFLVASGYSADEANGRTLEELEGAPRIIRGTAERGEVVVRRKDGSEHAVERRRRALGERGGEPMAVVIDRPLVGNEDEFRLLVERSQDILSRTDARGTVLYVSPAVYDILGYRPEELVGRNGHELLPADEKAPQLAGFARGLAEGVAPPVTVRQTRKDGGYRWIEYHSTVVRGEDGSAIGYQSIGRDVTARREAETALRAAEARFVTFLETIPDPIVLNREGKLVFANRPFAALVGFDRPEDLVDHSVLELVHPDDRPYVSAQLAMPQQERTANVSQEHRLLRRDGSAVPIDVVTVPVVFRGESASLVFVHDLREKKRLEAQLVIADRMASLGRLSASIGHEINNPLAYALGALDLLDRELQAPEAGDVARRERLASLVTIVREGTERVRAIVADMKALARGDSEERGPVDVLAVLDQCAKMAEHEIRHRAKLVKRYAVVPPVLGSEARLGQVFLNLLVNAAEAIGEGEPSENEITVVVLAEAQDRVAIEIRDTGPGIAPELRERVFEPFFTTKGPRAGTGLGLSVSHHIVTSLGGSIAVGPNVPHGACFRVILPASASGPRADAGAPVPPPPAARGRVLVVDDEPLLLKVVASLLGDLDVTCAKSGREALGILRAGARFDAIVCDLHMEDVSGVDLYDLVKREIPGLERRMVFMTGGAVSDRARTFVASSGCTILQKPFPPAQLIGLVHALVERPDH